MCINYCINKPSLNGRAYSNTTTTLVAEIRTKYPILRYTKLSACNVLIPFSHFIYLFIIASRLLKHHRLGIYFSCIIGT
jgi:hypothetical protein